MLQRCTNPRHPRWKDYGGRGIRVPDRWLKFENFLADMGEQPKGLTLERRDNSKGYSKANCYWATRAEQNNNRRSRYRDKTHCDQGHALSGDNLYLRKVPGRIIGRGCRICDREKTQRYRERLR